MATWTGPHAGCGDTPSPRDSRYTIIAGDVFSMRESVYAAIYDVLYHSEITDRILYSQCRVAAHDLMQKEHATSKIRPCIVMKNDTDPLSLRKARTICVTTSWEKTPLTELPELYEQFSAPLFPHSRRISRTDSDHYHSLPGWDMEDAYIFAWQFKSKRPLINRWPNREVGEPPEEPVVFGQSAMTRLVKDCIDRREGWLTRCRLDPKFAEKHAREILEHCKKLNAKRAKLESHAQTSCDFKPGSSQPSEQVCRSRTTSHTSWKSRSSVMSGGDRRRVMGVDGDSWRKSSQSRTRSNFKIFGSMASLPNALRKNNLEGGRSREADSTSLMSTGSNRFSLYRNILAPSRRGSRDSQSGSE